MHPLTRTARITGALYLGLALTGIIGFLVIRPQVFITGDAVVTLEAIATNISLARVGLMLELGLVVAQVLTALWFFKLFRSVNPFAAASLATLGMMNAVAILGSVAALRTALAVAEGDDVESALQVGTLVQLSEGFWSAGGVFFGLWLIPMGYLVLRSGWIWPWLGWTLVAGGVGYMVSILVEIFAAEADVAIGVLTIPSVIGEFGMIGYLIIRGVHPRAFAAARETVSS